MARSSLYLSVPLPASAQLQDVQSFCILPCLQSQAQVSSSLRALTREAQDEPFIWWQQLHSRPWLPCLHFFCPVVNHFYSWISRVHYRQSPDFRGSSCPSQRATWMLGSGRIYQLSLLWSLSSCLYFRIIFHCVCKSMYMFMYGYIHLHAGSCGVEKPKAGVFLSIFLCIVFEKDFYWTWKLPVQTVMMVRWAQGSSSLFLPGLVLRQALWHLAFWHGIWELNSDLHTSIASSLLAEPSPQPPVQNFWALSTSLWRLSKLRKGGVQMKQTFGDSTYVVTNSVKLNVM